MTRLLFPLPQSPQSPTSKPHIIVLYSNGKVECQECPGYAASSICAHAVAASMKRGNLDVYLKWLVASNRKSGGPNYSKAITFGMPAGRGRKGGRPPRSRRGKQTTNTIVRRIDTPSAPVPLEPSNDYGRLSPTSSAPAIPSSFAMLNGPSTGVQLHHPGYHTASSIPTPQMCLPAVPSLFPELNVPSNGVQLHGSHHGYHTTPSNPPSPMCFPAVPSLLHPGCHTTPPPAAAAGAWHSGLSPHRYHLVPLPSNVKKCYGCGDSFAEKFRQLPNNIVVKHVDRRVMRRDQATGVLMYSPDYTNTYYHPSFAHIRRKNPMFNGQVFIETSVYRALSFDQAEVLKQYDLEINICN